MFQGVLTTINPILLALSYPLRPPAESSLCQSPASVFSGRGRDFLSGKEPVGECAGNDQMCSKGTPFSACGPIWLNAFLN